MEQRISNILVVLDSIKSSIQESINEMNSNKTYDEEEKISEGDTLFSNDDDSEGEVRRSRRDGDCTRINDIMSRFALVPLE